MRLLGAHLERGDDLERPSKREVRSDEGVAASEGGPLGGGHAAGGEGREIVGVDDGEALRPHTEQAIRTPLHPDRAAMDVDERSFADACDLPETRKLLVGWQCRLPPECRHGRALGRIQEREQRLVISVGERVAVAHGNDEPETDTDVVGGAGDGAELGLEGGGRLTMWKFRTAPTPARAGRANASAALTYGSTSGWR